MALNDIDRARVKRVIACHLGEFFSDVDAHKPISELGADSMDMVELVFALEEEFRTTLNLPEANDPTVQDYMDLVNKARN